MIGVSYIIFLKFGICILLKKEIIIYFFIMGEVEVVRVDVFIGCMDGCGESSSWCKSEKSEVEFYFCNS